MTQYDTYYLSTFNYRLWGQDVSMLRTAPQPELQCLNVHFKGRTFSIFQNYFRTVWWEVSII